MSSVLLRTLIFSILFLSSTFASTLNFFDIGFKDSHKSVSVTLITENEETGDFVNLISDYVETNVDRKIPIYLNAIDPISNDPTARILLDDFVQNNNSKYDNIILAKTAVNTLKRFPAQEESEEEKKLNWDEFNKFYNTKNAVKKKAFIFIRGFVNGTLMAVQGIFFDRIPVEVALSMGSILGLLSSGIMKYDYLLNKYVGASLTKKLLPNSPKIHTIEGYARWFSLELSVLTILKVAQFALGAVNFPGLEALPAELGLLMLTGVKTLFSQGVYEMALLKWAKEKKYEDLIKKGEFLPASKIRAKIETGKLLGSMVWALAAIAELSGYSFVGNIAFGALAATGGLIYYFQPIAQFATNWFGKLKSLWHETGVACNHFFSGNKKASP